MIDVFPPFLVSSLPRSLPLQSRPVYKGSRLANVAEVGSQKPQTTCRNPFSLNWKVPLFSPPSPPPLHVGGPERCTDGNPNWFEGARGAAPTYPIVDPVYAMSLTPSETRSTYGSHFGSVKKFFRFSEVCFSLRFSLLVSSLPMSSKCRGEVLCPEGAGGKRRR